MKRYVLLAFLAASPLLSPAQDQGQVSGEVQSSVQTYREDSIIGAEPVAERVLTNTFANLYYRQGGFEAGVRFEAYLRPMLGFDARNNGAGLSNRYVAYHKDGFGFKVGNFYEQFGSGILLRSYFNKNIDYDNAFDGFLLTYDHGQALRVRGMMAKQRSFFQETAGVSSLRHGPGIVRAIDLEWVVNESFEALRGSPTLLTLGASFVSKFQDSDLANPFYNLPANVASGAGRLSLSRGFFLWDAEVAYKVNDPSADNGFIYKPGNGFVTNLSYSRGSVGGLLTVKRMDNMSFRSDRNANLNLLSINFLPAAGKFHTYPLTSFYPYATQPNGEWAFYGELFHRMPKEGLLGGPHGALLNLSFSFINDIHHAPIDDSTAVGQAGSLGYRSDFFRVGREAFFRDFTLEYSRKLTDRLKAILTYQRLFYNFGLLFGKPGEPNVRTHAVVADFTYRLRATHSLHLMASNMATRDDMGSWAAALVEYSVAPHWFFSVIDQYNYGNPDPDRQAHYLTGGVTYASGATRVMASYGKTRAGVVCVGGVCRNVPASNGLTLTFNTSF